MDGPLSVADGRCVVSHRLLCGRPEAWLLPAHADCARGGDVAQPLRGEWHGTDLGSRRRRSAALSLLPPDRHCRQAHVPAPAAPCSTSGVVPAVVCGPLVRAQPAGSEASVASSRASLAVQPAPLPAPLRAQLAVAMYAHCGANSAALSSKALAAFRPPAQRHSLSATAYFH